MTSQEDIETAVCEGITRFEEASRGRAPKKIYAHLLNDLLVVRLEGVLTVAEHQLAKSPPFGRGRDLLKQIRTHLIETSKPLLEALVQDITGVKVLSLHHDLSTVTGEAIILFSLTEAPCGKPKKK